MLWIKSLIFIVQALKLPLIPSALSALLLSVPLTCNSTLLWRNCCASLKELDSFQTEYYIKSLTHLQVAN